MTIETLRKNPTNQIESLANSLPDQRERDLILAFLQNPIIATKIEQATDYIKSAKTQEEKHKISGEIAGWAFEWLSFTHLQRHTKHILFSPKDVSDLYRKRFPDREFKNFFFQGLLLNKTRIPDMIEVRNAGKTLQITRIIETTARQQLNENGLFTVGNLYGNLHLAGESKNPLSGRAMHEIKPADLEEKPAVVSPKFRVTFAVLSNFSSPQSKHPLEKIPISSFTLFRIVQAITSGSI